MGDTEATYEDPGICPKCRLGVEGTRVDWREQSVVLSTNGNPTSIGYLRAVCLRCRYWWPIRAADEIDDHKELVS